MLGRVGASYSLRSPNRPPPSPAHPAIPSRLAALRVGAQTEMPVLFASRLHRFASFCATLSCGRQPFFFYVTPHSGAGAHGIARARGEPSDNLCSQRAEDGSPLERAQSEATSARIGRARQRHPNPAERSNVSPNQQSEAAPPNPGRPAARQTDRWPSGHVRRIAPAVIKMRIADQSRLFGEQYCNTPGVAGVGGNHCQATGAGVEG